MNDDGAILPRQWMLGLAIVALGVVFVCPLALAPRVPLLDPDEGLHASIAQEMVERGDWLVPRLLGKPFLDKPILYFWAEALSLRLLGMSEAAVRLPGLLFGLLGVLTTALLARRLFDRPTALLAGLFYATTILPAALVQAAAHDVALIPWINLSILLFWEADQAACGFARRSTITLINGLVLALAILTKGLVGVAIVGVAYGGYLLLCRRLNLGRIVRGGLVLTVAIGLGSLWYLAVERQSPGFLRYFFYERHVLGFATDTQRHGDEPWWYYLPILLGGGLPWIAYLPVVFRDKSSRHTACACYSEHTAVVLLACWLIGSVVLLSIARSKMVTYLWPVFPPIAILAAVAWQRLLAEQLSDPARRLAHRIVWICCLMGPALLPAILLGAQSRLELQFSKSTWMLAVAAGALGWAPLLCRMAGCLRATLAATVLATVAQGAIVMTFILPQLAEGFSARELADHFNHSGRFPGRLMVGGERIGSLVFYLAPELREGLDDERLMPIRLKWGVALPEPREGDLFVVPERFGPKAEQRLHLAGAAYDRVGRYRLYRRPVGQVANLP